MEDPIVLGIRDIVRQEVAAALHEIELGSREWYGSDAAATYLGTTRAVVHQLVHEGRLPRNQEKGHKLMFSRGQLDEYLDLRRR